MTKKLFYLTDLDGTILKSDKTINSLDLSAIEKLRKKGGNFGISTGRTVRGVKQYFDILNPDMPSIFYNGALIYTPSENKVIYSAEVPEKGKKLAEHIKNNFKNVTTEVLRLGETYAWNINYFGEMQMKLCNEEPIEMPFENINKNGWLKILFASDPENINKLIEYINTLDTDGLQFVRSAKYFYEILPAGITKGSAMKFIKNLYGDDAIIAAAGDFDNDIEMLKAADFAGCPANAQDSVKAVADYVATADNNNGATSEIINRFLESFI